MTIKAYFDASGACLGRYDGPDESNPFLSESTGSTELLPEDGLMIWSGSAWEKSVAVAKSDKCEKVDALYLGQYALCTHLTYTWQADRMSAGAIIAKHHFLEGTPPATATWVDAGNVERALDWADFVSLKDRIFQFHEDAFAAKIAHRAAINDPAKDTVAKVEAYDITTGWPT